MYGLPRLRSMQKISAAGIDPDMMHTSCITSVAEEYEVTWGKKIDPVRRDTCSAHELLPTRAGKRHTYLPVNVLHETGAIEA